MKGLEDYSLGVKKHHRRRMWNAVIDRLAVPKQDAIGLVLGGPHPEDLKCIESKGMSARNIIYVERDAERAEALKSSCRSPVIRDDIGKIMEGWTAKRKLDYVFLDTCSTISAPLLTMLNAFLTSPGLGQTGAVMALNVQHGREAAGYCPPPGTHRCVGAMNHLAAGLANIEQSIPEEAHPHPPNDLAWLLMSGFLWPSMRPPVFGHYRSRRVGMDWMVGFWSARSGGLLKRIEKAVARMGGYDLIYRAHPKIAPALAIHTMRFK
jgi:hypothetical protein